MDKRGRVRFESIVFISLIFFILVLQIQASSSSQENTFIGAIPSAGGGGGFIQTTIIQLTEQGDDYNIRPSRLKFEYSKKEYAIQLNRVEQENAEFIVMTLDMNKPNDITAYTVDDSFSLKHNERKDVDIDKNGIEDISIKLNGIAPTGKYNSLRAASFFIKKINPETPKVFTNNKENNAIIKKLDTVPDKNNVISEEKYLSDKERKSEKNLTKVREKNRSQILKRVFSQLIGILRIK